MILIILYSNKKYILITFSNKSIIFGREYKYPPKKKILVNIHINNILPYSAKKKNTNITAACSVIKPLTNSDSASAKSKGALFVSAIAPIKKIKNIGNKGKIYQIDF